MVKQNKNPPKDKEILRNCVAHIIAECKSRDTCIGCPFNIHVDVGDEACFFNLYPGQPEDWTIRKPPRKTIVTSTEVESIKALK